jgi:type I pantothenate kinase
VASRYLSFARHEWAALRAATPLTLDESDVVALRGINEHLALDEVVEVYLPLSRLLNLFVNATRSLHQATGAFLGELPAPVPFVVGLAGSVAVGKSTTARVLQALLARWPDHPRVDLVATDGFLLTNAELDARGLGARKGFPESYDVRALVGFLAELKSGVGEVRAPVYSHDRYDIVEGEDQIVRQPDIVIVEGLNVLQPPPPPTAGHAALAVSDYFDFTIYVDAATADIERWYVERFLTLCETSFQDPQSFFHGYASLSPEQAGDLARYVWREINLPNLTEHILPTRERAHLVLSKGPDHQVERVLLRRL